jgi:glycyl-tRNA synthetase beta chain
VKILVEGKMRLPIRALLGDDAALQEFFLDRIRHYFREIRGFKYDEINAVLASGWDDLVNIEERLEAVRAVRPTPNFEPIAASFKRMRNILRQAGVDGTPGAIDAILLESGPERELYDRFTDTRASLHGLYYPAQLMQISRIRPELDLFFDKILVNAQDPEIRRNRLALLHNMLIEFSTIADFSEIVTNF